MKNALSCFVLLSVISSNSFAVTMSKDYRVETLQAYLHVQCDEDLIGRSVQPDAPSILPGANNLQDKREFALHAEGMIGNFIFHKKERAGF